MRSIYLGGAIIERGSFNWDKTYKELFEKKYPIGENILAIAVKNSPYSMEQFLQLFPNFSVVRTFPSVVNINYLYDPENHTLETYFIRRNS